MIRIAPRPRWEDEALAEGRAIAIFTGTRAELLASGGAFRIARDRAALERLEQNDVAPFTRAEKANVARMLARREAA